jgi:hypothetical protein
MGYSRVKQKNFLRLSSRIGLRTVVASSLSLLAGLGEVLIAEHHSADFRFCQENVGKACPSPTLKVRGGTRGAPTSFSGAVADSIAFRRVLCVACRQIFAVQTFRPQRPEHFLCGRR